MSLLIWSIVTFGLGLLAYLAGGVGIAPSLPPRFREAIGDHYFNIAYRALWRSLLAERGPEYDLVAADIDASRASLQTTINGETHDFVDPLDVMDRCCGRPHGLVHVDSNTVTNPALAGLAARFARLRDEGRMTAASGRVRGIFGLSREPGLLSLSAWPRVVRYGGQPSDGETTHRWTYLSQLGFNSSKTVKYVLLLLAYSTPILAVAIYQYLVGTGAGVDVIGLWVGGLLEVVA